MTRTLPLLCLLAVLLPSTVLANGNFSHLWVATDALNYLEEGELRDFMTRPELRDILRNGAMFPDGGYAVGDGYGEISHWEPLHLAYLEWIRENYQPPWSDEAAQHIAFLMGMATHGMSDQLYDGMYLERHEHYDEHGSEATTFGVDGATDACFAATQEAMELPEIFVPAETLAPLYEQVAGHKVEAKTIQQGQQFVVVAIMVANDARDDPETLAEYLELYPYACGNQDNPAAPGSPVTHGPAVARYWQVLWARLHGETALDKPLLGTFFTGGTSFDQPVDASNPDSWVHFALPFGIAPPTVNADTVTVIGGDGEPVPVNLHVYYGKSSHLVNVKPVEDWTADTEFTVTITPPVESWDGGTLAGPHAFTFATFPEPVVVVDEPVAADVVAEETTDEPDLPATDVEPEVAAEPEDSPSPKSSGCSAPSVPASSPLAVLLLLAAAALLRRFRRPAHRR